MTAVKASLWQRIVNTWRHNRRKRGYAIDMRPDGFIFTARRRATAMNWSDVTRIDIGLRACLTFDVFYVQIFTGNTSVYIEELDDGFRQFEFAMFERWPQIRPLWQELLKVGPSRAQHHTVWQRDA